MTNEGVMLRWRTLTWLGVAVSVVMMFVVVQAQQRASNQSSLTPMDYIAIQQLVARYPYTFDGGLRKGAAYADLFTTDGVFINQDGRHEGREELERLGGARRSREAPLNVAHYIVNHVIEPLPSGGAKGQEYLVVLDMAEEGPVHGPRTGSLRLAGQYPRRVSENPSRLAFQISAVHEQGYLSGGRSQR